MRLNKQLYEMQIMVISFSFVADNVKGINILEYSYFSGELLQVKV